MKKWIVLLVALMMVASVEAKKGGGGGDMTLEQYIAAQQKALGKKFDEKKVEKEFKKLDKNGDGVLSADEQPKTGKGKK